MAVLVRHVLFEELTITAMPANRQCVITSFEDKDNALYVTGILATEHQSYNSTSGFEGGFILEVDSVDMSRVDEEAGVPILMEHGLLNFLPHQSFGMVTGYEYKTFPDGVKYIEVTFSIPLVTDGIIVANKIRNNIYTGISIGARFTDETKEDLAGQLERERTVVEIYDDMLKMS